MPQRQYCEIRQRSEHYRRSKCKMSGNSPPKEEERGDEGVRNVVAAGHEGTLEEARARGKSGSTASHCEEISVWG